MIISIVFFGVFVNASVERTASVVMSVISGLIVAWIILSLSGILREFSIKSPFFEMTANIVEKINDVKKETEKIQTNLQNVNQRIDNVITNISNNSARSDAKIIQVLGENKGKLEATLEETGITQQKIEPEKKISHEHIEKIDALMNKINGLEESLGKIQPPDVGEIIQKANYYFYKHDFNKAIELYDDVLEQKPDNPDVLFNKAYSLSQIDDNVNAIEYYKKYLNFNPNSVEALGNIGINYARLENYTESLKWYEKVSALNPKFVPVLIAQASALSNLTQNEGALKIINDVLDSEPKNVEALRTKAEILNNLGNFDEAMKLLDEALILDPNNTLVINSKAHYLLRREIKVEDVEVLLQRSLILKPENDTTVYNLACAYALDKKYEEAITALEKAISMNSKWKKRARQDKDFRNIYHDQQFIKITS